LPLSKSCRRRIKLRSCIVEYTPLKFPGEADWARQGVDTRYKGSAPPSPRRVHPRMMRKQIQSVRWLSCSSEGKRWASPAGDRPVSETSLGTDGTKGTCGNRKAQSEFPSGCGRRLAKISDRQRMCSILNPLRLDEPLSQGVQLPIPRSQDGEQHLLEKRLYQ
jgi:hypothetical protein